MTDNELLKLCEAAPQIGKVTLAEFRQYVTVMERRQKTDSGQWKVVETPYMAVDGRIMMARVDHQGQGAMLVFSPATIWADSEDELTLLVTVTSSVYGAASGTATSKRRGGVPIEAQHPWEIAETSALGRALGSLGYGLFPGAGLASSEDMQRVGEQEERQSVVPVPASPISKAPATAKSYLDDDVKMTQLLEYLFASEVDPPHRPGIPMKIAKAYAEFWKSRPDIYKDRQAIFDHALILRDMVRKWLVFDINEMLARLGIERDEAKKLLDIGSFGDLLELRGALPKAVFRPIVDIEALLAERIAHAPVPEQQTTPRAKL